MDEGILVIPKKPPVDKESDLTLERKIIYDEFANRSIKLLNKILDLHNAKNFHDIETFIRTESSYSELSISLPTCLLTNSTLHVI